MLARDQLMQRVHGALKRSRVVVLLGPRQCGKTTLARQIVPADSANYFDLEHPLDIGRLAEPLSALETLQGTVVIDEVQRRPDLFPVLRVLADRTPLPARFLVLGSASPALLRQSSESLAGRVERVPMGGLTLEETGLAEQSSHWLRGGFPRSFLATHQGAEIDLVLIKHGRLLGIECKRVDAPVLTPSMRIALRDLDLGRIAVVYPGTLRYALAERVEAVPLAAVVDGVDGLFPESGKT